MHYTVKALRGDAVVDVHVDAEDPIAARDRLACEGYDVLAVRRSGFDVGLRLAPKFPTGLFTEQLVALLAAGLNVVEALQALELKERTSDRRRVILTVLQKLRAGESFSGAITQLPESFPSVYAAVVRASERTGDLQLSLTRYLEYEKKFDGVRKKVTAALLYPAILIVAGCAVLAFLMFYVVPRFARIYEDLSGSLPFFSALLLTIGGWMGRNAPVVAAAITLGLSASIYAVSRTEVRTGLTARLWRLPAIGDQMKTYQLARLYATLGMLLRSGVPIVASMGMAASLLSDHLARQLERARKAIEEGSSISSAMAAAGLSTAVGDQMLLVGERSGEMGQMMERVAGFYDDDLARWLDWTMRLIEPLLMATIGIAIGFVVVLMYMPVFELANSLR